MTADAAPVPDSELAPAPDATSRPSGSMFAFLAAHRLRCSRMRTGSRPGQGGIPAAVLISAGAGGWMAPQPAPVWPLGSRGWTVEYAKRGRTDFLSSHRPILKRGNAMTPSTRASGKERRIQLPHDPDRGNCPGPWLWRALMLPTLFQGDAIVHGELPYQVMLVLGSSGSARHRQAMNRFKRTRTAPANFPSPLPPSAR